MPDKARHPGVLYLFSLLSYNEGSIGLTTHGLGFHVRTEDCQPSVWRSSRSLHFRGKIGILAQLETDAQGGVDFVHLLRRELSRVTADTLLVDGPQHLQHEYGSIGQTLDARQLNVGGHGLFTLLRGGRRDDDCRGVVVTDVVLKNEHRARPALLMAEGWFEICVIDLAAIKVVEVLVHRIYTLISSCLWYVPETGRQINLCQSPFLFFVSLKAAVCCRRSFFHLRFTYEASHRMACDGCYRARTIPGGEFLLSAVIASRELSDFTKVTVIARPKGSWRVFRFGYCKRGHYLDGAIRLSKYTRADRD